jgi:hypothetical protein
MPINRNHSHISLRPILMLSSYLLGAPKDHYPKVSHHNSVHNICLSHRNFKVLKMVNHSIFEEVITSILSQPDLHPKAYGYKFHHNCIKIFEEDGLLLISSI